MFKRRTKRSWFKAVADIVYPPGGFGRAFRYLAHRIRRLPDPAHRISRGIAAGVFTCFTPFFGFHFLVAALLSFVMRGNLLASLLATFFGNPLTFPFIAGLSMDLGYAILGREGGLSVRRVFGAFGRAGSDLYDNFRAIFTDATTHWPGMSQFFYDVFLPYLVGGLVPGIISAAIAYAVSRPLIAAYQKARIARMKKAYEKRQRKAAKQMAAGQGHKT